MSELPSYLDRCTSDLEEFVLSYPREVGGAVVATGAMFSSSWVTPKERWIFDSVRASIEEGRNVLVFLRHTGGRLPARYLRLFKEHLGQHAVFLDVRKVKAACREDWLNEHVIEPGRRILVTNPKAVQSGLNNLVQFLASHLGRGCRLRGPGGPPGQRPAPPDRPDPGRPDRGSLL